jgi:hypothetical protein
MRPFVLGAAAMAATLAGGCGLIDPNITDFELRLPEKEITVDTGHWELADEASMPSVECAGMEGICQGGVNGICGADSVCFGACEDSTCKVLIAVALWNEFRLDEEVPELVEIDRRPLGSISVSRIHYAVTENTFNVESPEFTVHLAPQTVMSPGDPQAEQIGVIEPLDPGETVVARDVLVTDEGHDILQRYIRNYTTPFNLIIGATIELRAGDPMPMGKLVSIVRVDAHAGLR